MNRTSADISRVTAGGGADSAASAGRLGAALSAATANGALSLAQSAGNASRPLCERHIELADRQRFGK